MKNTIKSKLLRGLAVVGALAIPAGGLTILTSGVAGAVTKNTAAVLAQVTGLGAVVCPLQPWATLTTVAAPACIANPGMGTLTAGLLNFRKATVINAVPHLHNPGIIVTNIPPTTTTCFVYVTGTILLTVIGTIYNATFVLTNAAPTPAATVFPWIEAGFCGALATGATVTITITVT